MSSRNQGVGSPSACRGRGIIGEFPRKRAAVKKSLVLITTLLVLSVSSYTLYAGVARQVKEVPATVRVELAPPGVCGDQNDDGVVDILDVVIDLQITVESLVPTKKQLFLSDLNQDGAVDVFDVIVGLRQVAGIIPPVSECG